jgi:hypothetical protein
MESMALFVKNFGKFMKKKGYKSRKRRDNLKNKDQVRRCFRCKSKDHILVDCPYNSDEEERRHPRRRHLQVSPSITSLLSSTHHHASWLSPLR